MHIHIYPQDVKSLINICDIFYIRNLGFQKLLWQPKLLRLERGLHRFSAALFARQTPGPERPLAASRYLPFARILSEARFHHSH
jgi:hypothetical protein